MSLSALEDASREPTAAVLHDVLGASAGMWSDLVSRIAADHAPIDEVWHFGGSRYGWNLRLTRKGRVVVYLTPLAGGFLAGLVLGDKAVGRARDLGLPSHILTLMDDAPRYAEGRGFRVPIEDPDEVAAVVRLIAAKMAR